jgi:hypothetical protein
LQNRLFAYLFVNKNVIIHKSDSKETRRAKRSLKRNLKSPKKGRRPIVTGKNN